MDEELKPPTEETPTEPARMEPAEPGVGDIMKEGTRKAIAGLVVALLIAAYITGIAYAEVHGLNLLRQGVAPDLIIWAYAGMVALGVLAIALPLALHYWAFDPTQRIVTYIFYFGVDLPLLGINAFTDFGSNTGAQLTQWAQIYKEYIMPSTPVIAAMMATILLLLDPHARAVILRQAVKAAVMQKKANDVIKAANRPEISAIVDQAAAQEVSDIMSELFGRRVTPGYVMDASAPPRRSLLQSFFDGLFSRALSAIQGKPSENTPTQSPPSE